MQVQLASQIVRASANVVGMAYTHHNDAMTSAHNTIQHLWCISHDIVMMSVSHFLVSRLFGASLSHS